MSDREKKLLIFFGLAGFLIVNFLGYSFAAKQRDAVKAQRAQAIQKLEIAETALANRDEVSDEIEWLAEHEPEPQANQDVQTSLQGIVEREAKTTGLTIKPGQKPLPTDTTGTHYHRAKIQISVTGTEESLYRWFDRINVPDQFRIASQIRLSPNQQDDTKIDCTATIEQWFVPKTS
jgi:hypothetical protein